MVAFGAPNVAVWQNGQGPTHEDDRWPYQRIAKHSVAFALHGDPVPAMFGPQQSALQEFFSVKRRALLCCGVRRRAPTQSSELEKFLKQPPRSAARFTSLLPVEVFEPFEGAVAQGHFSESLSLARQYTNALFAECFQQYLPQEMSASDLHSRNQTTTQRITRKIIQSITGNVRKSRQGTSQS